MDTVRTPTKLVGFVLALGVVFAGAYGLGRTVPEDRSPTPSPTTHPSEHTS